MNAELTGYISLILALLVGGICYVLMRHTADTFDRWHTPPRARRWRT